MTQNRLGAALSPYLRDHSNNPVDWWEWSPDALREAQETDRPILLSVGYAACHWCHVMAHESFEDAATAQVMNRLFVNVKVDREERPDIDQLYMTALQAMGEQGGWPMTLFLTPAGKPFFGGTYYPPRAAHGRPSFTDVLNGVSRAWRDKRDGIEASAAQLSEGLGRFLSRSGDEALTLANPIGAAADAVSAMADLDVGGLAGAPKFPSAPYFELLLRNGFPNGPSEQRAIFIQTVGSLCQGGIYDHVGGGLHRYSVDGQWLVPHFEKMLYDNAQFLRHLAFAYRATGDGLYLRRIDETLDFLENDLQSEGGGFAASLDADSLDAEGHLHEGAFYVWSSDEIDALLGDRAARFAQDYGVTAGGNFEGSNILNRPLAARDADDPHVAARQRLLLARQARAAPKRDDKVLADWNGLAIRALAEVWSLTGRDQALDLALGALHHIRTRHMVDGRLVHAERDGRVSGPALSSDYGALLSAAVSLYAATGDSGHLDWAEWLADALERWHGDGDGCHRLTASDAHDVLFALRGDQDEAVPGATALVVEGLVMLAQATGSPAHLHKARRAAEGAFQRIAGQANAFPGIVAAIDRLERGSELTIAGSPDNPLFGALWATASEHPDPNRLVIAGDRNAAPSAMLCRQTSCRPPVHDTGGLSQLLEDG